MEDNKKVKRSLGRNFKQGMYYSIVTVFVIAMVIIINMFVTKMDIKLDFTKQDLYTLTDATKEYVSTLEDDITIYFLAKENDKYEVLQNVINQYGKLSHISVVWKDPELYPQFAAQYTDSEVTGNDVIVVNETKKTSKFIAFSDMYIEDYSMNYSTYNYDYSTTLDAEGQITSAIQYVTTGVLSKIYTVSVHGETAIDDEVEELIKKGNYELVEFDARTETAVPDDCDVLLINGPTADLSEDELNMYKSYLDNGGKAIFTVAYTTNDMTNYYKLLEYYGVNVENAIVCEPKQFIMNYPTYIMSTYESVDSEGISADFELNDFVIAPVSLPLTIQDSSEYRSTLTVNSIVKSTEDSYAKVNPESEVVDKEDGDLSGPFDVVIQASDTYKDKSSKVVICSSPFMFKKDWIDFYNNTNIDLLIDTVDWMSDKEQSVTIPKRSLDSVLLNVDTKEATMWGVLVIFVLPVTVLGIGIVLWILRRRH